MNTPAVVTPGHYDLVYLKFARVVELWNRQPINVIMELKSFIYFALNELLTDSRTVQRTAPAEDILEYIVENLADLELTVNSLCRCFFISESQLRRKIVKSTGLPPNEYILTLRLNRAKNELVYTTKPIRQIAEDCGFSSPNYFSAVFLQIPDIPPAVTAGSVSNYLFCFLNSIGVIPVCFLYSR